MQLTLCDFDELSLNDRMHLVCVLGVLVSRVQTVKHTYQLYVLYDFYVEVVLNHQGTAAVSSAVAFHDANRLNKHLNAVDLSCLELS